MYSSVAKKLQSMGCETEYYTGKFGFGYHVPYPAGLNATTVTLFRNPYSRIVSAFLYGKGIHQIMFPLGFPDRAKVKFKLRETIKASEFPILTYAQLPGIASCQTKMVLGMECGQPVEIDNYRIIEAQKRIRDEIAFVGLTEESDASARLFLAMFDPPNPAMGRRKELTTQDKEALVATLKQNPRANKGHTASVDE